MPQKPQKGSQKSPKTVLKFPPNPLKIPKIALNGHKITLKVANSVPKQQLLFGLLLESLTQKQFANKHRSCQHSQMLLLLE